MHIGVVIQARMSSRRLPGKMLAPIAGRTLLDRVIDRAQSAACETVVLATSRDSSDDALASVAAERGVVVHRGSLDDVAGRMLGAAEAAGLDAFVRVNGDSPLLHPALIDSGIALFSCGDVDLATNVAKRTYPRGMSVEVIRTATLARLRPALTAHDREHVTTAIYRLAEDQRIVEFFCETDYSDVQMSVDTPDDLDAVEQFLVRHDGVTAMAVDELLHAYATFRSRDTG